MTKHILPYNFNMSYRIRDKWNWNAGRTYDELNNLHI